MVQCRVRDDWKCHTGPPTAPRPRRYAQPTHSQRPTAYVSQRPANAQRLMSANGRTPSQRPTVTVTQRPQRRANGPTAYVGQRPNAQRLLLMLRNTMLAPNRWRQPTAYVSQRPNAEPPAQRFPSPDARHPTPNVASTDLGPAVCVADEVCRFIAEGGGWQAESVLTAVKRGPRCGSRSQGRPGPSRGRPGRLRCGKGDGPRTASRLHPPATTVVTSGGPGSARALLPCLAPTPRLTQPTSLPSRWPPEAAVLMGRS